MIFHFLMDLWAIYHPSSIVFKVLRYFLLDLWVNILQFFLR